MLKFIIILFLPSLLFSKNIDSLINEAEEFIMQSRFLDAKNIYFEASQETVMWEKDLINGLLCCLECNDYEKGTYFIQKLFKLGAPPQYFEQEMEKYDFFKSNNWMIIKESRPVFNRESLLIKTIEEMIEVDQHARQIGGDSIEIADFRNYLKLKNFVKKYGFPEEKDLGFDYTPMGYKTQSDFDVLIIHAIKSRPFEWGEYLPKLLKERKISHNSFVFYMGHTKTCDDEQMSCMPPNINTINVNNKLYTCCCEVKDKINKNRSKYGIESIDLFIKKTYFKESNKSIFKLGGGFPTYGNSSIPENVLIEEIKKFGFDTILK